MNPIVLLAGAAAAGGAIYKLVKKPAPADYQVQNFTSPAGVRIKVATPVPAAVTKPQQTGIVSAPPAPSLRAPQPVQTPSGVAFAPPKAVVPTSPSTTQPAPILITPTGAASLLVGSVLDVQRGLNTLGYQPLLVEDGKLGPKTVANVRAFQSDHHLAVDGNAGPATRAALSAALQSLGSQSPQAANVASKAPTGPVPQTEKEVQHALNVLGTQPPLAEDGAVGPKTIAAIKSFQMSHGLAADGVAGPKTKAALAVALGSPVALPPPSPKPGPPPSPKPVYSTKSQTELGPYDTAPNRAGLASSGARVPPASQMTPRDAQHALNLLGASPPLTEDGAFGPKSQAALMAFQRSHNLAPDGVLGPRSKAALDEAVNGGMGQELGGSWS